MSSLGNKNIQQTPKIEHYHQECDVAEPHGGGGEDGDGLVPPFSRAVVHWPGGQTTLIKKEKVASATPISLCTGLLPKGHSQKSSLIKNSFSSAASVRKNRLTSWTRWSHFEPLTRSRPRRATGRRSCTGWWTMYTPTGDKNTHTHT